MPKMEGKVSRQPLSSAGMHASSRHPGHIVPGAWFEGPSTFRAASQSPDRGSVHQTVVDKCGDLSGRAARKGKLSMM